MEELRSTEVLEREILEDARKKAFKTLKTADDTLASQKKEWERKISTDVNSIRNLYSERLKKNSIEIFARLPLDKRRLRLKTHEDFLTGALNDFLTGLGREKLLFILERELLGRLGAVADAGAAGDGDIHRAVVRYSGLSLSETRGMLKKAQIPGDLEFQEDLLGNESSASDPSTNDPSTGDLSARSEFPSIAIDTEAFRITASIKDTAAALLKDHREDLAVALLGTEVLND